MPLSEHEERILAEIERRLAAEDPRFAARARRPLKSWSRARRIRVAIVLGIVGLGFLLALTFDWIFGVVGMTLLLVATLLGARAATDPVDEQRASVPPDELT
jgi:hypothetical protein